MSDAEITGGSNAVEAKLAEAGADQVRRHSFSEAPDAAPDIGTPAEEVADQPRNELGQFASQQEEEIESPEVVAEEEPEIGSQSQDPAVQAILNKYGGDPDKALQAMVHLQRKNGEQSNELGDLRRMVDELSQLRELQQADMQQRQQNQPLDQATVDWFDQEAYNNPHSAAEYARQQNNNVLLQRALSIWKETSPGDYAVYVNNLNNERFAQEMEAKLQKQAQLPADASLNLALTSVLNKSPELISYSEDLSATMQKYPHVTEAARAAMASGDTQQLEGAIETLYALAERDTLRKNALSGNTPESTTTTESVVTPTVSETHEPAPEPTGEDRFRAAFREEADRRRQGVWVAE